MRTAKSDFLGRLATVEQAVIAHSSKRNDAVSGKLKEIHDWITIRFEAEIAARK